MYGLKLQLFLTVQYDLGAEAKAVKEERCISPFQKHPEWDSFKKTEKLTSKQFSFFSGKKILIVDKGQIPYLKSIIVRGSPPMKPLASKQHYPTTTVK